MKAACEKCGRDDVHTGPFSDSKTGEKWKALCGSCKFKVTLSDPERKARLVKTAQQLGAAIEFGGTKKIHD